jgi:endoglucanase
VLRRLRRVRDAGRLDAVRGTGATNVVTVSGIDWANNLTQWLAYKPADPLNQLAAEAHVYDFNICGSTLCFDSQMGPVAAAVPLVFGEAGDTSCGSTYISKFFAWMEAHGSGGMVWVWDLWGDCLQLISDFSGTPKGTYGSFVRSHYRSLR